MLRFLISLYTTGIVVFFVLFLIFAMLYWHALRHRAELELDRLDVFDAQTGVWRHLLTAAVAFVSILITLILPRQAAFAGLIYFVLGPLHTTYGFMRGRARAAISA